MKRILITGASGFIGKHLCRFFSQKNYDVIGWDRSGDDNWIKKINLCDRETILEELKSIQPDTIIHCAGLADVGKSIQNPEMDYEGNVTLTHCFLFALHKLRMDHVRFVFLSSAGVYGNPSRLPITEDTPLNPLSPYAVHKVMCEELCKYFINNYGMDIKVARIFSAYGKGLKKQIFWDMCKRVRETGRLDMFGTGNESRDYIHINDVTQALYILSTSKCSDVFFNIANGEEITIRCVAEYFAECIGVDMEDIAFNGIDREGNPRNWKADIRRIQKLGYIKTVDMRQGMQEYVNWAKEL